MSGVWLALDLGAWSLQSSLATSVTPGPASAALQQPSLASARVLLLLGCIMHPLGMTCPLACWPG